MSDEDAVYDKSAGSAVVPYVKIKLF